MTQPTISIELIQKTLDYLSTQPWSEVNGLIKDWQDTGKQPDKPTNEIELDGLKETTDG